MSEEKQTPVGLIVAIVAIVSIVAVVAFVVGKGSSNNQHAAAAKAAAEQVEAEQAAELKEMQEIEKLFEIDAGKPFVGAETIAKAEALMEANLPGNRLRAQSADSIQELVEIWCAALGGKRRDKRDFWTSGSSSD